MKKKDLYNISYEMKNQRKRSVLIVFAFSILFITLVTLFLSFLVFPIRQSSVSMEPTVSSGSCVFVNHLKSNVKRGQVVLISSENQKSLPFYKKILDRGLAFFTAQQYFPISKRQAQGAAPDLRRIVGLPGDTIYMKDYVLYIKPAGENYFLTEFEFVKKGYNLNISQSKALWDSQLGSVGSFDEIVLGENEYFVLSDNRTSALDSRLWGPVKASRIIGKAIFKYFPLSEFGIF